MSIEASCGPILDVADAMGSDSGPSLDLLGTCLATWIEAGSGEVVRPTVVQASAAEGRFMALTNDARALLFSYFEGSQARGRDARGDAKPKATPRQDRGFPWREYIGTACTIWGQPVAAAWDLTVPEWWALGDAHNRSMPGNNADGPTTNMTWEQFDQLKAELILEQRDDLRRAWREQRERAAERERGAGPESPPGGRDPGQ